MEQRAKRIGKLNVVDLIAVLLILAVAALAVWKLVLSNDSQSAQREMIPITFQVKVEGVPVELYENCKEYLPCPMMASGALVGGDIVAVEKEPFYVLSANGEWVEDKTLTTLLFTATTSTPAEAVMTTKVGDQEVRIGKANYILKSEYIEFTGSRIVDVQWGEPG